MVLDFSSLNEIKSPRHLTLQLYNNPQVLFSSENETVSQRVKMVIEDSNGIAIKIGPNRSLNNGEYKFHYTYTVVLNHHLKLDRATELEK